MKYRSAIHIESFQSITTPVLHTEVAKANESVEVKVSSDVVSSHNTALQTQGQGISIPQT